jgi:integrase
MRFTGCRPSEARKAKWDDVDFERNVIRLYQHKTSKTQREKKPRNIVLPAIVQRLLGWIRRNQKENPISVIRDILADGPVPAPEFRELARRRGVSMHDFYKLTRQAGAKCRKTGPVGAGGAWVWELHRPETHGICRFPGRKGFYARICHRGRQIQRKLADDLQTAKRRMRDLLEELGVDPRRVAIGDYVEPAPIDREHIFLNQGGQAWTKWNLSNMMQRGRRRAGLTRAVRLYQVRHHYASELVRANTNLKVIAELLGHTTLTMVSWYCHIAGDLSLLLNAVEDALEARRAARAKIAMSL